MMLRHLVFETDGGTKVEFMYNGKSVVHCINGVCTEEDPEITRRVHAYLRGIVNGDEYTVRVKLVGVEPYATLQVIKRVVNTRSGPVVRKLSIKAHRAGDHPAWDVVIHARVDTDCTKLVIAVDPPSNKAFREFNNVLAMPLIQHLINEVVRTSNNACVTPVHM